jgi:aminoglycoside phosphotransferase (APT) family kinase protein
VTPEELSGALEAFLAKRTAAPVRVQGLRRLTGGASRETWSLDAVVERAGARETLPLILQRDTRGGRTLALAQEYELLRVVHAAGTIAPEPMFAGDDSLNGNDFFLVRRVDGETLPRRLLREERYAHARGVLPEQLATLAARLHGVSPDDPALAPLPRPQPGQSGARFELEKYELTFRTIAPQPHPALELGFRWLRQHPVIAQPSDEPLTLVHGDFRMGNVLFGEDGARALLDWELAHLGDPMEDLAWMCVRSWRFGGGKPVGGVGAREPFFAAYEAAGGKRVDPERVRWWEIFGNVRWGVMCIGQALVYLEGRSNSVELASIGRRTAETEWELLRLIS